MDYSNKLVSISVHLQASVVIETPRPVSTSEFPSEFPDCAGLGSLSTYTHNAVCKNDEANRTLQQLKEHDRNIRLRF